MVPPIFSRSQSNTRPTCSQGSLSSLSPSSPLPVLSRPAHRRQKLTLLLPSSNAPQEVLAPLSHPLSSSTPTGAGSTPLLVTLTATPVIHGTRASVPTPLLAPPAALSTELIIPPHTVSPPAATLSLSNSSLILALVLTSAPVSTSWRVRQSTRCSTSKTKNSLSTLTCRISPAVSMAHFTSHRWIRMVACLDSQLTRPVPNLGPDTVIHNALRTSSSSTA